MGRRRRDDSDSDVSDSEGSESEDSYDGSGSETDDSYDGSGSDDDDSGSGSDSSEDEEEIIKDALKSAGMKKYFKNLQKAGIDSISAAEKVSDKKLNKIGVSSSGDRKKILKAFKNLDGDSSDSDDDDEEGQIHSILKKAGAKKSIKYFEKYGISTMKKAKKLDESKLKKLGVTDSKARKQIIKAFGKGGGADSSKIESALKKADLKQYVKTVKKHGLADKKVDTSDLKEAGVDKEDRKDLLKVLNKLRKSGGDSDESGSDSDSDDSEDEAETVRRLLARAKMKKYYPLFKKKGVDTVESAKNLQHKDLREMGIHLYRERRDIIEEFEKYNGEDLESVSSGDDSDDADNVNMVHEVLRQQYMSRHIPDFDRMGITTLRQARKLTQTQLRSMGVALYLQRERLINAFADYRPKNKVIMKILIDCNLASHAREFEKLIDVEDAKNLTHSDLRAMGINLYGQRERLMRAFMEFKPKGKDD